MGLAILAAVAYGAKTVAVDIGSKDHIAASLFANYMITGALCVIPALFTRGVGGLCARDVPLMGMIGMANAAAILLFSVAATHNNVAVASILGSLDPIVVAVLALVFLKQKVKPIQVAAIGIVILGSVMVALGGHKHAIGHTLLRDHLSNHASPLDQQH